jgi:hyperosmotically inducible periplasmic protein
VEAKLMFRTRSTGAVVIALALIATAFAACGKTAGETIDDAAITAQVKTSLLNDPDVGGLRIDVDTSKGLVTLSGIVKSKEEEAKAIAIARRVEGVRDVRSTLQISPSS